MIDWRVHKKSSLLSFFSRTIQDSFLPKVFIVYSLSTLLVRWPGHDSEDIKNLRNNSLSKEPIDFWGGASAAFYGNFPNIYPGWESLLLVFQWFLTFSGLIFLLDSLRPKSNKIRTFSFALFVLLIQVSTLITRDSLMLSMIIFGVGLGIKFAPKSRRLKVLLIALIFTLFLCAASLRPWISPAIFVLFLWLLKIRRDAALSKFGSLLIPVGLMLFTSLAILLEVGATKVQELKKSYPEQQVMLMDLSATVCWSTNSDAVAVALKGIKYFYEDKRIPNNFCNTFKPSNWVHLMKNDSMSSRPTGFRLISPGDRESYSGVRNAWFEMLTSHPVDYVQNKFMYASQTLLGGDTREIKLLELNRLVPSSLFDAKETLYAIVLFPLDVAISLHLFSPFIFLLLLMSQLAFQGRTSRKIYLAKKDCLLLLSFQVFWVAGTVVAYIGDTARFTYVLGSMSLLVLCLSMRDATESDFCSYYK